MLNLATCSIFAFIITMCILQHVLEKGNEHERGQIITKLAGQVVPMSQNKFASNVIERCFEHGGSAERELLVKEILKQTEGNNYLLVYIITVSLYLFFFPLPFHALLSQIAKSSCLFKI